MFAVGGREYPILAWSSKSHRERTVPLPPETVAVLERLRIKAGGSLYVFLPLDRLAALSFQIVNRRLRPTVNLVNNMNRQFDLIQESAHRLMAIADKTWQRGTIHDLRKTYGTMMARHVPMHELKELLGHASITTTADFYLGIGDDVADRVRAAFSA